MTKAKATGPALAVLVMGALVMAALHFGRPLLAPLAVALLLTFLLAPAVNWMQRRGLPAALPVVLVMLAAVGLVVGVGALVIVQSRALLEQLPAYESNIREKLTVLRDARKSPLSEQAQHTLEELGEALETAPEAMASPLAVTVVEGQDSVMEALSPLVAALTGTGLTLMLTFFMLLQRRALRDRIIHMFGRRRLGLTTRALDEAAERISLYLRAQGLINLGFGSVIGVALFLMGLPFAAMWGLFAALLRFVPYLGPWIAAAMPVTLSLATSPGWTQPLVVLGVFIGIELVVNMIIEPVMYGRSAGLSSVALVLAVAFWTLLWGPVGLFVATPLTACLCVLCGHVPQLAFIPQLLGDGPVAADDAKYFQRLLAHDEDEALQIALEHSRGNSPERTFDELLVPALSALKTESRQEGGADEGTLAFGLKATMHIVEALDGAPAGHGRGDLPVVLACAASDEFDALALEMLRRLLQRDGLCELRVLGSDLLASEVIDEVERTRPAHVLIGALAPGGLARARLLCHRLRALQPRGRIIVGRWHSEALAQEFRLLLEAGADNVSPTLQETRQYVNSLSLLAQSA